PQRPQQGGSRGVDAGRRADPLSFGRLCAARRRRLRLRDLEPRRAPHERHRADRFPALHGTRGGHRLVRQRPAPAPPRLPELAAAREREELAPDRPARRTNLDCPRIPPRRVARPARARRARRGAGASLVPVSPVRRTPPLIVGAGPAGCAAAVALAAEGVRPLLIDRDAEPRDVLCGGFLSWRTAEQLRAIGVDPRGLGARRVARLALFSQDREVAVPLPAPAFSLSRRAL